MESMVLHESREMTLTVVQTSTRPSFPPPQERIIKGKEVGIVQSYKKIYNMLHKNQHESSTVLQIPV